MTLVLTKSELERIRGSLNDHSDSMKSTMNRKAELKKLSEDRVKHWPNTLEAMRKKKESFLKDKAEQEEMKRQEIDKQEAELRRNQRLESIKKANDMLYEKTDKMKMLRSQQLYADIVYDRQLQVKEKERSKDVIKLERQNYHEYLMEKVREGDELERQKIQKQKDMIEEVKHFRSQQRDEVRSIQEEERRKNQEMGEKMKREAEQRLKEEMAEFENKQKIAAETNLRMLNANEELKRIREELKEKERLAQEERDKEIEKIEDRKKSLKMLEIQRFNKAQITRQKIIDAAVKKLAEQTSNEQRILDKQMQELRDKEDAKEAHKLAVQEKIKRDLEISRKEQIDARELKERQRYEEESVMLNKWRLENEEAMKIEEEKQRKTRLETIRIKNIQYEEGQEAILRKKAEKEAEIEQMKLLNSLEGEDDKKFAEIVKAEIEKNIRLGKPIYTLLRALEYSQPIIIPAKLVKVDRSKKDKDA